MTATDKQINFIKSLADGREMDDATRDRLLTALETMERKTASATIDWLLKQPKKNGGVAEFTPVEAPGVYEVPGEGIFVVKPNRAKTGLYAKRLVESAERLTETDEHVHFDFEYAPGAMRLIRPEHRMDVKKAKALTVRYGRCINCGRDLKAAKSVEQGIGPVCIKAFGPLAVEPVVKTDEYANRVYWKTEFAKREAEQERQAYEYEMVTQGV